MFESAALHRLKHERDDLDIGRFAIGDAVAFHSRLPELARTAALSALRLKAKGRPVIAITRGDIGAGVTFEIEPRDGHGEIRPEAQLLAGKIGEDIGAAAQRLADLIEKDVGGLQD